MEEVKEVKQPGGTGSVELLKRELEKLEEEYTEINQTAIVSADGRIAASSPEGSTNEKLSAMSAFLLESAQKSSRSLGWSDVGYLLTSHQDGYLIVAPAGNAFIVLLASPRAKLGLLLYDVKEAARRIKLTLEGE